MHLSAGRNQSRLIAAQAREKIFWKYVDLKVEPE
jgi:hypothetical protein